MKKKRKRKKNERRNKEDRCNLSVNIYRLQAEAREPRRCLVPEAADHHRATRVVGNRSSHGPHDHRHGHSGPLWQRPRCRILGGVYARVLEAEARQVGPVQGRAGRGGEY